MKRFLLILLLAGVSIMFFSKKVVSSDNLTGVSSWLCYYQTELPSDARPYDLYIFANEAFPALEPLKAGGSKVVGYISLGEVSTHSPHFQDVKGDGLLVDENPNWPGSFRVNFAGQKWNKLVINTLIPQILAKGFQGIFIDTIDTAIYLENDKKIDGNIKGAIKLIKDIRKKFPNMIIVLNNGLFLVDQVGKEIDALVVEDIYTTYDFKAKKYKFTDKNWISERIKPLKEFQTKFKKPVLALDYIDELNKKDIEEVAIKLKGDGFVPYIATIELDKVFFHP